MMLRFRTLVIRATASLLNLNSELCCYADPDHPVGWRDHLRWWIEDRLSSVFVLAWDGSDEELRAVDNDEVPAEYMSQRQRAYAAQLKSGYICPIDLETCDGCAGVRITCDDAIPADGPIC